MKGFINKIRTGIFTLAVVGMTAPLTTYAGNHGGSGGNGSNGSGSGGGSFASHFGLSSGNGNSNDNNKSNKSNTSTILPQTSVLANLLNKSHTDKHNDNATDGNATTGSTATGLNKSLVGPGGKINGIVTAGKDKKTDSKAIMDAQAAKAAADKAYVDAQNFASVERGRLGTAQAQYDRLDRLESAAGDAYAKNMTPQNDKALADAHSAANIAGHEVAKESYNNNVAIANVNAKTAARDNADAALKAATATSGAGSGGSGKSSSGGILSTNHYPAGQVFTSNSYPMGSIQSTTTFYPTATAPVAQPAATTAVATTATTIAVAAGADLVLEDFQLAAPATLVAGPAYTVKFRNQGTDTATKFQIGLLAEVDGKPAADAPRAAVEVKSLAAGASAEVTLRLPQSALKMIAADGRPTAFTQLLVAVDLMNQVAESDETNNTAIVDRATLETTVAN